ncbi:hypothetical protein Hdeb2414_s0196g00829651 [Helianthus debilis subsp. tardiflorus]
MRWVYISEERTSRSCSVPDLKWDLGLFEQIVRSFRFPPEWDARYPAQGQTAADAPPGYITLYEDFFLQGNLRLPATNFLGHILHYYNFHLSQMSLPGMVRVRHFEFLCRSHGIEPSVEKFRAFYQLQRTMGFFSFASRGAAKKILLNPPKSFHDWKAKFFFIREEVLPIAMPFRDWTEAIPKEDLPIPKNARWYQQLNPTPNRVVTTRTLDLLRCNVMCAYMTLWVNEYYDVTYNVNYVITLIDECYVNLVNNVLRVLCIYYMYGC